MRPVGRGPPGSKSLLQPDRAGLLGNQRNLLLHGLADADPLLGGLGALVQDVGVDFLDFVPRPFIALG